jgi:hypothetical protein
MLVKCAFCRVFAKTGVYVVVFCGHYRGELCGERGASTPRFSATKNTPGFETIFSG